jgi:hypothetical protein
VDTGVCVGDSVGEEVGAGVAISTGVDKLEHAKIKNNMLIPEKVLMENRPEF